MTGTGMIIPEPATMLYKTVIDIRNRLYDLGLFKTHSADIPTVSIGNITAGGTGKTPLVDFAAKHYSRKGLRSAILSRGYRRSTKGVRLVSDGRQIFLGAKEAGDECTMLAHNNPGTIVVVAEQRKAGIDYIIERFAGKLPDVVLLDDAFQHRKISRDLDIVVISSIAPFFDDRLLPFGKLREPVRSLHRADLLVLSKVKDRQHVSELENRLRETAIPLIITGLRPGKPVPIGAPDRPPHGKVIALAGIGQPEGFLVSLQESGMDVTFKAFFPDHADFPQPEIEKLVNKAEQESLSLVMTEKDYYRFRDKEKMLRTMAKVPCFYLPVSMTIPEGQELLERMLDEVVGAKRR